MSSRASNWDKEKKIRREFAKNQDVGYFYINRGGKFKYVNRAWLRMHGYASADEIIGKGFEVTQVKTDFKKAREILHKLLQGERIQYGEFTRLNRDGSVGHHLFTVYPVKRGGKIIGIEGLLLDIPDLENNPSELNARRKKYWVVSQELERINIGSLDEMSNRGQKEAARLTKREIEILHLAGESFSNRQIAERLFISVHTVLAHRKNIMAKLKIHKCTDLILYALKGGISKIQPHQSN